MPRLALAVAVVYLLWRSSTLGSGWLLLLSIPLYVAEIWGVFAFAALVHLSRRDSSSWRTDDAVIAVGPPCDIVISMDDAHSLADLERTLLACRSLPGSRSITVVSTDDRPGVADLARAHGCATKTLSTDPLADPVGLLTASVGDIVLWLAAGQTPMVDIDTVAFRFERGDLAVLQCRVGLLNNDSLVHVVRGRDSSALMRDVVSPALSSRGMAPWQGPGSFIRREALRDAASSAAASVGQMVVRLHTFGWRTEFETRPLVRSIGPDTLANYLLDRRDEASKTLALLGSADSPLRLRHARGVRLTHLALAMRFGHGIRLATVVGVVSATLVSGTMPFTADLDVLLPIWAAVALLMIVAHRSIVGTTLAFGDSVRDAWRTFGPDLAAATATLRIGHRRTDPRLQGASTRSGRDDGGRRRSPRWIETLGALRPLSLVLVVLETSLVVRAATLVRSELLPAFGTGQRVAVLAFSVGMLVPMLDVVQLLARRRQRRRTFRLDAALDAVVDGVATSTLDVSASGVAVQLPSAPPIGSLVDLRLVLPRVSGETSTVRATAHVRSNVTLPGTGARVGLEFAAMAPADRAALVSYCTFDHPSLTTDRAVAPPQIDPRDFAPTDARRPVARALAAASLLLGLGTAVFGPSAAGAATNDPIEGAATIRFLTHDGVPIVGAPIRTFDQEWIAAGPTDDNGTSVVVGPEGASTFEIEITFATQRVVTVVTSGAASPIEVRTSRLVADEDGAPIEVDLGEGWQPFQPGIDVLAGRIVVRTADGTITKLEIPPGAIVAVPSGEVVST